MAHRSLVLAMGAFISLNLGGAGLANEQEHSSVVAATAEWAQVLEQFVNDTGQIAFHELAEDRDNLDRFVAWVGEVSPETHPERFPTAADVLAYHINAYNALSMQGVLAAELPKSLGGLRKYHFFGLRQFVVGGRNLSLYTYENDVIRKLGEPRVHFALNCMSISCPRLPREPFKSSKLETQLERETRAFFMEPRNVTVDTGARRVTLSKILDFYEEDFVNSAGSLIAYANRYLPTTIPAAFTVRFFSYDWGVNYQKR